MSAPERGKGRKKRDKSRRERKRKGKEKGALEEKPVLSHSLAVNN